MELSPAVSIMSSCATTTYGLKWETAFTSSHMVCQSPGLPGGLKYILLLLIRQPPIEMGSGAV